MTQRFDAARAKSNWRASVQVLQGGLGSGKCARAPASAGGKVDEPRERAGTARPPEIASYQKGSSSERPPRVGSGASEIVMLDGDGKIVVVNQAWRETVAAYGLVLRDAGIGTPYVDVACRFLPDLDRAALELSLRPLLSGDADDVRHTYAIRTARGLRWRHVQITPLSPGTTGRFVAIHEDLTELAMARAALKLTSEQLLTARDEERQRIAVELHNSTNQHLAAMSVCLARLRRAAPNGAEFDGDHRRHCQLAERGGRGDAGPLAPDESARPGAPWAGGDRPPVPGGIRATVRARGRTGGGCGRRWRSCAAAARRVADHPGSPDQRPPACAGAARLGRARR